MFEATYSSVDSERISYQLEHFILRGKNLIFRTNFLHVTAETFICRVSLAVITQHSSCFVCFYLSPLLVSLLHKVYSNLSVFPKGVF